MKKLKLKETNVCELSWKTVGDSISVILERILKCKFACAAENSDNYIYIRMTRDNEFRQKFCSNCFSDNELALLLQAIDATHEEWANPVNLSRNTVRFYSRLYERLLRIQLNIDWEKMFVSDDGLFLFGVASRTEHDIRMRIDGINLSLNDLRSQAELLKYLTENGPTHTALMEFCEEYRNKYFNELCWHYPISDGKHLGTFLVLVKDGVLSLPYDNANGENYEEFCIEDVCLFDADAMSAFIQDWESFSSNLIQTMNDIKIYLVRNELLNENKTIIKRNKK